MSDYFALWLPSDLTPEPTPVQWGKMVTGQAVDWQVGNLEQAAAAALQLQWPVLVLIPGVAVTITHALVPSRKRQIAVQAVPFALEDEVAEAIEDLHFALGVLHTKQPVIVSIIQHRRLQQYVQRLAEVGIHPDGLLPDSACLPPPNPQSWQMLAWADYCLLRLSDGRIMACYAPQATLLLQLLLAEIPQLPQFVDYYGETTADGLDALAVPLQIQPEPPAQALRLPPNWAEYNLLQGQYAPAHAAESRSRWYSVAVLLLLLAGAQIGQMAIATHRLQQQKNQLNQRIEQLYRQTFPNARTIVNARVQMERELKQQPTNTNADFLSLLAQASTVLLPSKHYQLQQLTYRDNRLDIRLSANSLQTLEQLKQQLTALPQLAIELQAVTTQGNQIEGRLTIGVLP